MKSSLHIYFTNKRKDTAQVFCFFTKKEAQEAADLERERFGTEFEFIAENQTNQTYICDFCSQSKTFHKHEGKDICTPCFKKVNQA